MILDWIKQLSGSQGFYQRLYDKLTDGSDESSKYLEHLESQNFKDIVDLVLYLES